MNMKKFVRVISFVMIFLTCLTISGSVLAAGRDPGEFQGKDVPGMEKVTNLGNQIITIVSTVGSLVSVIVLVVLGIKYMMGSAEEKAEYKKTLLPYFIGAGLVFAASTIASMVFSFTSKL